MNNIEAVLLANLKEFVGFARKRIGDPELASDVVQDSLLKALKAADEVRDEESAKPWFYRILRRTIVDLYRRRAVREKALQKFEQELNVTPSADEELLACACMERLLPTINPQYATLIQQIDLNGEAPEMVAAGLGITKGNLNVRHHRARQQLRRRLEEHCRICAKHGCLDCHCAQNANTQKT
jgi:RNA polymerase sigma factor (sigma-70 family)